MSGHNHIAYERLLLLIFILPNLIIQLYFDGHLYPVLEQHGLNFDLKHHFWITFNWSFYFLIIFLIRFFDQHTSNPLSHNNVLLVITSYQLPWTCLTNLYNELIPHGNLSIFNHNINNMVAWNLYWCYLMLLSSSSELTINNIRNLYGFLFLNLQFHNNLQQPYTYYTYNVWFLLQ